LILPSSRESVSFEIPPTPASLDELTRLMRWGIVFAGPALGCEDGREPDEINALGSLSCVKFLRTFQMGVIDQCSSCDTFEHWLRC